MVLRQGMDYPRWYVGLRWFLFGVVVGMLLLMWLIGRKAVVVAGPEGLALLWGVVGGNAMVVACLECGFAWRRYRAVRRAVG